jgi:hypothetical protein
MTQLNLSAPDSEPFLDIHDEEFSPLRAVGLAAVVMAAVTMGLYVGREVRFRYKFRRRTPSDFFANAGNGMVNAEYGMGI